MAELVVVSWDTYQDQLKNMSAWALTGVVLLFHVLYVQKHYKENCFKCCPDNEVLDTCSSQFYCVLKLKLLNVIREMEKYKTWSDKKDSSYIYMFIGLCIHMGENGF